MKHIIVVFVGLCLFVGISETTYSQFRLGLAGGVNIADLSVSNIVDGEKYESLNGAIGGMVIEYGITDRFSLYARPQFAAKGAHISGGEEGNTDISLSYLELPLGVKFILLPDDFKPYVIGGIAYATNTNAETTRGDHTNDIKENVKDSDFLLNIGLGIEFGVTKELSLFFDARYSRSLTNLNDNEGSKEDVYTSDIMLSVGFLYGI